MATKQEVEEVLAAIKIVQALAEAIRDVGSIPSGQLYAHVMQHISIQVYEGSIRTLEGAGLITKKGNLLMWIGPAKEKTDLPKSGS